MMLGLALGWVLGIGTAILMLQFAAAALTDDTSEDLFDVEECDWAEPA